MGVCENQEDFLKSERSTYSFRFPLEAFPIDSREELVKNLSKLFIAIAEQLELCVLGVENDSHVVRCESSTRARAILFGACALGVTQTIDMNQVDAVVNLDWTHPQPEDSIQDIAHIARGSQKRSHFVRIFNGCWNKGCQTLVLESLAKSYQGNSADLEEFLEITKEKMYFEFLAGDVDESLDCTLSLPKSLSKRSSAALSRVRFSEKDDVAELPLSREEREARMGSGGSAVFPNGCPKPLRNVKTGGLVWYVDFPEETRRVIAPFNYENHDEDRFKVDLETRKAIAPFNYGVVEPLPVKKRPIILDESPTKVVPCSPSDNLCKPKGILKTNESVKRFKYEVDRHIIAPFNYLEIDA